MVVIVQQWRIFMTELMKMVEMGIPAKPGEWTAVLKLLNAKSCPLVYENHHVKTETFTTVKI
jgi:hypothetical protein